MDGKCQLTKSIVYKASIVDENGNTEHYTNLTKNTFRESELNWTQQRESVHFVSRKNTPNLFHPNGATLNNRSELYSTCRHRLSKLIVNTWMGVYLN